jgi:uncharacterized protein YdhG (YjbR/CyaY superfamily)
MAAIFNSVQEYLDSLSIDSVSIGKVDTIKKILSFVTNEFPDLEIKLAWNVPTIHKSGQYVVGVAAYKHHITFSVFSKRVIQNHSALLDSYKSFQNCFQIPVNWELDEELIRTLVAARLVEIA